MVTKNSGYGRQDTGFMFQVYHLLVGDIGLVT